MIIIIDGHLIQTNFIYTITEVEENTVYYEEDSELKLYGFEIKFLNEKEIYISRSIYNITEDIRKSIQDAHTKLIEYWNQSKLDIPKITI